MKMAFYFKKTDLTFTAVAPDKSGQVDAVIFPTEGADRTLEA